MSFLYSEHIFLYTPKEFKYAIKKREEQLGITDLKYYWTHTNTETYEKLNPIIEDGSVTIYDSSNSGISLYENEEQKINMIPRIVEKEPGALATPVVPRTTSKQPEKNTPKKEHPGPHVTK